MTQLEVIETLKQHKDQWLNTKQLSKLIPTNIHNIQSNVKRLRKRGEIKFRLVRNNKQGAYEYIYQYKD